jgi:hypothetical protein
MAKIEITVPDHVRAAKVAEYVAQVGVQIAQGYLSGHVDAEHHWASEGVQ